MIASSPIKNKTNKLMKNNTNYTVFMLFFENYFRKGKFGSIRTSALQLD
jgi:hypothetical protein